MLLRIAGNSTDLRKQIYEKHTPTNSNKSISSITFCVERLTKSNSTSEDFNYKNCSDHFLKTNVSTKINVSTQPSYSVRKSLEENSPIEHLQLIKHGKDLQKHQNIKHHPGSIYTNNTNKKSYILEHTEVDEHPKNFNWRVKMKQSPSNSYKKFDQRDDVSVQMKDNLYELFLNKHDVTSSPPYLTSQSSLAFLRHHYGAVPVRKEMIITSGTTKLRPKPFHISYIGSMPQQFKKSKNMVNNSVNNKQKLHSSVTLLASSAPFTQLPQIIVKPTKLQMSGSFKNLKSTGISDFFNNTRYKNDMQLPLQMPAQLYKTYLMPLVNTTTPSQITIDQFFPFKPQSPKDVNLLAVHQHQKQITTHRNKTMKIHKNTKLNRGINWESMAFGTNAFYSPLQPPSVTVNSTKALSPSPHLQYPKQYIRITPFKLNLNVFPLLPQPESCKSTNIFTMGKTSGLPLKNLIPIHINTPLSLPMPNFNWHGFHTYKNHLFIIQADVPQHTYSL